MSTTGGDTMHIQAVQQLQEVMEISCSMMKEAEHGWQNKLTVDQLDEMIMLPSVHDTFQLKIVNAETLNFSAKIAVSFDYV